MTNNMNYRLGRRLLAAMPIILGTCLVCVIAFRINAFDTLQLSSGDMLLKTSEKSQVIATDDKIIIVAIYNSSLRVLGKISLWPRPYHSRMVDILTGSFASHEHYAKQIMEIG